MTDALTSPISEDWRENVVKPPKDTRVQTAVS